MSAFSLTKWYVDCVDAAGNTAIAYWSAIAWRGVEFTWHSISLHETGAEPFTRSSAKSVPPPTSADGTITWDADPLKCRLTCHSRDQAFSKRLLERDEGVVDWRCEAVRGRVSVECDGRRILHGIGYAECLTMTLPPWRLPIDTLRWGRWLSDSSDRSVVWIDWQGPHPLTAVFVDGHLHHTGIVSDEGVETGGAVVTLADRHTLYSRSLVDTLGVLRPVLDPLLPPAWLALEDHKWRSRGTLSAEGRSNDTGWVIHETLRWPS